MVAMLLAAPASAAPSEEQAAQLFSRGRDEYQAGDYQHAYDDFKQAYLLSARPQLLYNMARALEGLKRYREAADALRSYLRVSQNDPERVQIEEHIRALDEAERIQSSTALMLSPAPPPLREPTAPPKKSHTLAIVLAVTSVAVAGLAVGLGVGLGTRGPGYSSADVGPLKSTP
jgi:tetratricopeptide (TPR) repeat protein